jgi:hypothetical protein
MTYGVAIQVPEAPITEEWSWLTDITRSHNGSEDSLPLLRYPRRTFSGNYRFDDKADLRRHIAMMTKRFRTEFSFPLFQYQCKLKAAVAIAATGVTINAKRGDFRVGGAAIIIEGGVYEEVEIAAVDETSLEFVDPLANAYTARAIVCPVVTVYTNTNASITRANPDHSATSSFNFIQRLPTLPFVSPLNEATVLTFDGLPLLPFVPQGSGFMGAVATGLQAVEYTGVVDLVSPWTFEQWGWTLAFKANHIGNVDDWEYWQAFADVIQGSANPFLFPTNREDFEVVTPATLGGVGITVKGDEYSQHYWGHGGFSRIFIDTDAGRHFAKVTGISAIGGNDRLTFTPALPGGAGWALNQKVGFLLKVRNDNDKITCNHYGLWTEIGLSIRTVV